MGNLHESSSSEGRATRYLDGSALTFDLAAEIRELQNEDLWRTRGHTAKTLTKNPNFRVVLIALKAGARMPEHHMDQRTSVHTLTGHIRLQLPDGAVELPAGNLLVLDRAVSHDIQAVEDSAFLLSITWQE